MGGSEFLFSITLIGTFWIFTGILMANEFYRGGDGNYYLIPVIVTSMILAGLLVRQKIGKGLIMIIFIFYFSSHLILTFITGPNRDPGIEGFNCNFTENPLTGNSNKQNYHKEAIRKLGIEDLVMYLPDNANTYLAGIGKTMLAYKLGYSYVNLRNVEKARGYLFKDYQTFLKLIKSSKINFLIMPVKEPAKLNYVTYFERIKEEPGVVEYQGKNFYLLDLRMFIAD